LEEKPGIDIFTIHFWRTKVGMEVDFILGEGEVAIEIKGTSRVEKKSCAGSRPSAKRINPASLFLSSTSRARAKWRTSKSSLETFF